MVGCCDGIKYAKLYSLLELQLMSLELIEPFACTSNYLYVLQCAKNTRFQMTQLAKRNKYHKDDELLNIIGEKLSKL